MTDVNISHDTEITSFPWKDQFPWINSPFLCSSNEMQIRNDITNESLHSVTFGEYLRQILITPATRQNLSPF